MVDETSVGGVADAVERGTERRRHDEILADIARFAGASLDLDQVLERIVQRAAELTGADRASIWLLDRAGITLLPSALYGMDPEFTAGWKTRPLPLEAEPLSREAVAGGQPVVIADAAGDPRTDKASVAFFGDQSILVAPLVSRSRVLGTLFLNHVRQRYDFSAEDVETTNAIAGQAAIAIDNARLYGDARRLAAQLRASFGYAGEALASDDVQHTLQMMVQLAVETVGAAGGSISLLDETGRGTYLVASSGASPPSEAPEGTRAEFTLNAADRLLGVLTLFRPNLPFTEDERDLLGSFAGHARTAIEHARLYASLQEEQERARHAEGVQAEFTSMISHELRTPLALIKGYVSTLLRPGLSLPPDAPRRFLEGIDQASERLRKLIDNLLSATALEAGIGFPVEPETLDVATLVQGAIARVSVIAAGRRFALAAGVGTHLALGDGDQLSQVFENLLNNAVKYAPGDTPIEVRVERRDARVVASVRDYGPGIPAGALHLIFDKFYRVPSRDSLAERTLPPPGSGAGDRSSEAAPRAAPPIPATNDPPRPSTASRRPGGMGLGLYICRKIVEAHGGRVWAENIPEGGAAFFVALPAVLQAPSPRSADQVDGRDSGNEQAEGAEGSEERGKARKSLTVRGN